MAGEEEKDNAYGDQLNTSGTTRPIHVGGLYLRLFRQSTRRFALHRRADSENGEMMNKHEGITLKIYQTSSSTGVKQALVSSKHWCQASTV